MNPAFSDSLLFTDDPKEQLELINSITYLVRIQERLLLYNLVLQHASAYFNLNFLHAIDDSNSIKNAPPSIMPEENAVTSLQFGCLFILILFQ